MESKEILEQARKENKNADLADESVITAGSRISMSVGMALCGVITFLEAMIHGKLPLQIWIVFMGMEAAMFTYKYIKLKKRHELVFAIFFGLVALSFCVLYGLILGGIVKY